MNHGRSPLNHIVPTLGRIVPAGPWRKTRRYSGNDRTFGCLWVWKQMMLVGSDSWSSPLSPLFWKAFGPGFSSLCRVRKPLHLWCKGGTWTFLRLCIRWYYRWIWELGYFGGSRRGAFVHPLLLLSLLFSLRLSLFSASTSSNSYSNRAQMHTSDPAQPLLPG